MREGRGGVCCQPDARRQDVNLTRIESWQDSSIREKKRARYCGFLHSLIAETCYEDLGCRVEGRGGREGGRRGGGGGLLFPTPGRDNVNPTTIDIDGRILLGVVSERERAHLVF